MIEIYTEQLNKQPKQAWSYVTRSDAYKEADDHANAAADLSKAIELAPGDGQLYARRGEFYRSLGKHDHAMADLFRAIELKPSWSLSIYGYTYDGYHTRAITLLSRQLEFNPTDSSALAQRGDAYLALGKIDHAIADIFKVVELDPNSALAYSRRAELHEARGELAKAIADLSRAIAIEPTVPWRHVRRAKLFEASGEPGRASTDYASAIDMLSKKLDTGTPNTDDLLSRAEVLEAKGDDARALEVVSKVIAKAPDWAAPHELRARLHGRKDDRPAMISDYQKVIALVGEPKTPWDFSEHARLHLLSGQAAEGLPFAEISLEIQPDVPAVLDIRGRLLEALGRREEAIADLRRAPAKRPDLRTSREGLKRLGADP